MVGVVTKFSFARVVLRVHSLALPNEAMTVREFSLMVRTSFPLNLAVIAQLGSLNELTYSIGVSDSRCVIREETGFAVRSQWIKHAVARDVPTIRPRFHCFVSFKGGEGGF